MKREKEEKKKKEAKKKRERVRKKKKSVVVGAVLAADLAEVDLGGPQMMSPLGLRFQSVTNKQKKRTNVERKASRKGRNEGKQTDTEPTR
jgi:hypothetical protein